MVTPAAMFIESAQDTLRAKSEALLAEQARELHCACGDQPEEFVNGYQLGIETARTMVALNVAIGKAGINPGNVL